MARAIAGAANAQQTAIIEEYERLLLDDGLIDFDGLVLAGLQAIERFEWVRKCLRSKFPVIVIDEYQDLGLPLHRMMCNLMLKAGVRIIAVGYPDQSIYGFTGAKPSLLRDLHGMPQVTFAIFARCDELEAVTKLVEDLFRVLEREQPK